MHKEEQEEQAGQDRREFLKNAGKVAVTAPAAALILNAATVPGVAQAQSGSQEIDPD